MAIRLIRITLEYLTEEVPVPKKRATAILIKIKSRNALLRVFLVLILSSLKLVLEYK